MQPQSEDFIALAGKHNMVPVYREIFADLDTPLTAFAKIAGRDPYAFLFESLEGDEKWGRYSFIGLDPILTFESSGTSITIRKGEKTEELEGDPLRELQKILESYRLPEDGFSMPNFYGGAVGYLGYDMVRFMEQIPEINKDPADLPDSFFIIPSLVLIFDNLRQTLTVVCCAEIDPAADPAGIYQTALDKINSTISKLRGSPIPEELSCSGKTCPEHHFNSSVEKDYFKDMVEKAKEYILAGDIIQVVLSQRFYTQSDVSSLLLYRALRLINPSPYLFYLRLGNVVQIGSSPEILVRLEGNNVEVRPIAGTRHRGSTPEEDAMLEEELLADPKEKAEHLMLVDLGRNDVGRVAEHGTVETHDLMAIERYSHVMHIVSGVRGKLAPGRDQFDVARACFPAGTVTGAPKIRAMEIIEELEPQKRGPYAGAVGYFGFSGNMDLCITIRTFVMEGDRLWVQAGAGVVADSDPEKEYQETINKARGLRRALELVEKGF